jgi:ABC-type amino acid transport substrate-binding protein
MTWRVALGLAVAFVVGIVASSIWLHSSLPRGAATVPGLLDRINAGEIDAGYGVYPPYTQEDPNTKKVTGFSVDIIEEIARQLNVKVVWHRINWNTMAVDLKRGTFDVIADPIFLTIPRAREFEFSAPYARFADGIGVVRINDDRFRNFEDLGKPRIKIVVGQGFAAEALIKARFPQANVTSIQVGSDLLQLYNDVLAGRADIAINDAADAERFVKEHSDKVKALWLDSPPAYTPAGFVVRKGDTAGATFLTVALENLEGTGILDALARRYNIKTLVSTH